MGHNFRIRTQINRSVAEVFDAVVKSESIVKYFTERTSGDLVEGEQIIWSWEGFGDHPVTVRTVRRNELIELVINSREWQKTTEASYDVVVSLVFEALEANKTMLSIAEEGWQTDAESVRGSYDNCEGWTHMGMCLKAFLEFGIDLRK